MINDKAYIDAVLRGDTRSFAPLVDKYKDMVFAMCMRMLKNREDAEDLSQEIFVKAFMGLPSFKGDSKFSTWLFRIAFNEIVALKRMPVLETTPVEDWMDFDENYTAPIVSTMEQINYADRLNYIQMALDKMKEKEALMLTLFYLNEHTVSEISDICSMSESNVKTILHRARHNMGEILVKILGEKTALTLI